MAETDDAARALDAMAAERFVWVESIGNFRFEVVLAVGRTSPKILRRAGPYDHPVAAGIAADKLARMENARRIRRPIRKRR